MSYSDQDITNAVNAIFDIYDKDKNGTLENDQITIWIDNALKHAGENLEAKKKDCELFISNADKDNDGKINKAELFEGFKKNSAIFDILSKVI